MLQEYEEIARPIHQYMTSTKNMNLASLTYTVAHVNQTKQPKRVAHDFAFPMGGFSIYTVQ